MSAHVVCRGLLHADASESVHMYSMLNAFEYEICSFVTKQIYSPSDVSPFQMNAHAKGPALVLKAE